MSQTLKRTGFSVFAAATVLGVLATSAAAQQAPAAAAPAAQCTAKATPAEVQTGQAAVKLTFELSSAIGAVSAVEAPEGSGIVLATATDIPRAPLANPTDQAPPARAIELAEGGNTLTVWLKTQDAKAGEIALKLQGQTGTCNGTITVK